MELVGLGYSGWFVYRYLLFKVSFFDCVATRYHLLRTKLKQRQAVQCLFPISACHYLTFVKEMVNSTYE